MKRHPMFKAWRINHGENLLDPSNTKKYRFKSLDIAKEQLFETKSKLDEEYKSVHFSKLWSMFDPFKYEKALVAEIGNTMNVSNAWLKCFELIMAYDMFKGGDTAHLSNNFIHFDNAAFPGSFVVAAHHLVNTLYPDLAKKYTWRCSSLLTANDQNTAPLEDTYGLYENYKDNWLMNEKNNGDVLIESNQLDFHKQLGGQVDLYTSDLGFDVSSDYNNQELLQMAANIGQILTGLLTVKPGGSFITKQYTTFEPATVAVMYAVSTFFDEFYLCKPYTSRMANSETYLVGKGFKKEVTPQHPYIAAMMDRIAGRVALEIPMFNAREYPKEYLTTVIDFTKELTTSQIEKLNLDIERVGKCMENTNCRPSDNPTIIKFNEETEKMKVEWFLLNPILPIADKYKLKMHDALGQA